MKKKQVTITMYHTLLTIIKKLAKKERRSVSNFFETRMIKSLTEKEMKEVKDKCQ